MANKATQVPDVAAILASEASKHYADILYDNARLRQTVLGLQDQLETTKKERDTANKAVKKLIAERDGEEGAEDDTEGSKS